MIKYKVKKNDDHIETIKVEGHALFGAYGTDIVCASVSTGLIMTANAIEILGYKDKISLKVEEGFFELQVLQTNSIIEGLLNNLVYTLNELEAQYRTYIKYQKEA
ncbi:ribosomal-processing cysteine protease Prp [Acholeplasma hippikon]|uniref:Ribosomal processing cysteine protease Prp n=1 Tax=Acholeplasma hippikon TaxID=264636 RepID=A0A449BJJ0_9MOLU|nr:ribosomal-processing cysteine protease Prp [Acholeplasma hippikon]VEU82631.1 Predicted ribosomal protein [Acholeplasma hippikon]